MDPQRPIYPQRVRKKSVGPCGAFGAFRGTGESRRFRRFRAFGGCTEYNVAGRGRAHIRSPAEAEESELRTQNSELGTQDSELRTQNSELRTGERKGFTRKGFLRNV